MTDFSRSQIPDAVDTVEKLMAWAGSVLAETNAEVSIAVNRASLDAVASAGPFSFPLQASEPLRYVVTAYLVLDPSYRAMGNVWESSVLPFRDGVIPDAYTS